MRQSVLEPAGPISVCELTRYTSDVRWPAPRDQFAPVPEWQTLSRRRVAGPPTG